MSAVKAVLILGLAMGLAGCDWFLDRALNRPDRNISLPPPPPDVLTRPAFVVVDGDRIVVDMEDGAQCLGSARGNFSAAGWTGTFNECPYPYTYAVALSAGTPAGPLPLQQVTALPLPLEDGEVPFRPIASVRITDTSGQTYRFESAEGF